MQGPAANDLGRPEPLAQKGERGEIGPVAPWVHEIRRHLAKERTNILEFAGIVYAARRKLLRGQWTQLCNTAQLPFTKRRWEMLAAIGKNLSSVNAKIFSHLPSGRSVLYQLSRLSRTALERYVAQGRVHPAMTWREARMLVIESRGQPLRKRSRVLGRLGRFMRFVQESLSEWTWEERTRVQFELRELQGRIAESGTAAPSATEPVCLNVPH